MPKKLDLTGRRYGRLTVIEPAENKNGDTTWKCQCDCGNEYITYTSSLVNGLAKSCGCLVYETRNNLYRYNRYLQCYEIYWETNDYVMYIDECDFGSVMKYYWRCYCDRTGYLYAVAKINNKSIKMLRFLKLSNYDHINRNSLDFRRSNLRLVTKSENALNRGVAKNNSSGVTGVGFSKKDNAWTARIQINHKSIFLGIYSDINDAIRARLKAEVKYCSNNCPQKHLYEQYGIEG